MINGSGASAKERSECEEGKDLLFFALSYLLLQSRVMILWRVRCVWGSNDHTGEQIRKSRNSKNKILNFFKIFKILKIFPHLSFITSLPYLSVDTIFQRYEYSCEW